MEHRMYWDYESSDEEPYCLVCRKRASEIKDKPCIKPVSEIDQLRTTITRLYGEVTQAREERDEAEGALSDLMTVNDKAEADSKRFREAMEKMLTIGAMADGVASEGRNEKLIIMFGNILGLAEQVLNDIDTEGKKGGA